MKGYLFGLLGLTLVGGAALAQVPMALPQPPGAGAPAAVAPAAPVVVDHGASCGQGGCCNSGCCTPTKTVCMPEQYMRKTVKPAYTCGCEPFCVDYPFGLFGKCACCGGRNPTPRTKKYLIKKVITTECPAVKCVPVQVPCCEQGHGEQAPCCNK